MQSLNLDVSIYLACSFKVGFTQADKFHHTDFWFHEEK